MKHQVMFVFGPGYYDELDSEWDNAFEASIRLKELWDAGFISSYTKKVKGAITGKTAIQLHARPLIFITVNGTPLETTVKFKSKSEAEKYLLNNVTMYRGVTYEIRVTQRYEVVSNKVLPIHVLNPEKEKFFNEVRVDEPANPEDNYCGGY